jgi:hypothetical protein
MQQKANKNNTVHTGSQAPLQPGCILAKEAAA